MVVLAVEMLFSWSGSGVVELAVPDLNQRPLGYDRHRSSDWIQPVTSRGTMYASTCRSASYIVLTGQPLERTRLQNSR
jgi:hypothetical protein